MESLKIIGTSHISRESINAVSRHIEDEKPDIVAVELDSRRAHALMHNVKARISIRMVRQIGVKGFLFFVLANFLQKKLGRLVGVEPGSDMKAALRLAIKHKMRVALIDRDLETTMRRLSKELTWKERFRFVYDIFAGFFSNDMKEFRQIDIRKVPEKELVAKVIGLLKKRYPGLHKVLVEERNHHMAVALAHIIKNNPESKILAVVGAGHEEELARIVRQKLAI